MDKPYSPGFVLPPTAPPPNAAAPPAAYPSYPNYPPQPQPQQQYPGPPHQAAAYQHQPFPGPIQHQPYAPQVVQNSGPMISWTGNANFQDYLRNATSFHVKQKVELLEAVLGWETENQYTVKDQAGNKVFYVAEESGCIPRQCGGPSRPFTLQVKDRAGQSVLTYDRPFDCGFFCCGCLGMLASSDGLTVTAPTGQVLGSVQESCAIINPTYTIKNAAGAPVLKAEGPACPFACGGQVTFRLMTLDGVSVGTISKEWGGLVRELFTDADFFSISFPIDLDAGIKAVCLGLLFLIDFQYFESGGGGGQGGRRLFG